MKFSKKLWFILLWISIGFSGLTAQSAIVPIGGSVTNSNGSASFTVGQIAYQQITTNEYMVMEGIQQQSAFFFVGVNDKTPLPNVCRLSPNPTTGNITLEIEDFTKSDFHYRLFNLQGQLLSHDQVRSATMTIPTGSYPDGPYFLRIDDEQGNFSTFKILKTK